MEEAPSQSDSDQEALSSLQTRPVPPDCIPEVPATHPPPTGVGLAGEDVGAVRSPPRPPPASARIPEPLPCCVGGSIPLQLAEQEGSISTERVGAILPILAACIDMSVAIIHMHIATTEAIESQLKCRKKKKNCSKEHIPSKHALPRVCVARRRVHGFTHILKEF